MKNIAASVKDRLKNLARDEGLAFTPLLEHFAPGRLFARLQRGPHADKFVLKGAQLFRIWSGSPHRPTRDADFLSFGNTDSEQLASVFDEICQSPPEEPDGLVWLPASAALIRDENAYGGVRVKVTAQLINIRIPIQVDIGFGDAVTPDTQPQVWASLLDYADVPLSAYPIETVIAEKFEAMVASGMANSRMKDFFDLSWISSNRELTFDTLSEAIHNTFQRLQTNIPRKTPVALTSEFSQDTSKTTQWSAFLRKNKLPKQELTEVITSLHNFLAPLIYPTPQSFTTWTPAKRWHNPSS